MPKEIPKVEVVKNERITISIWLIPISALLISLWLAYQYFSQLGPKITIEFQSSSGLKIKQSQVRFRDVPIGVVEKISLKRGGKSVVVTVRINKDAEQFLNRNAKFWIVKPKIDKTGITGLETLVSGSYIQLHSTLGTVFKNQFVGLEEPYLDIKNIKGKHFRLNAPDSYGLKPGSLVYCRNIEVGEIKHVKLSHEGDFVFFEIFIKEPYDKFVDAQTQFWNLSNSNFKFDMSKASFDVSLASFSQIIYGGIAFDAPGKQISQYPLNENHIFPLFASDGDAKVKRIGYNTTHMYTYQMHFNQTLGKLDIGAPVKFFDFQIGEVINIESSFNPQKGAIVSKILVDIDTSVFNLDQNRSLMYLNSALQKGLVAQLAQSSPLLESQFIELVYDQNQTSYKITGAKPYDIFPTRTRIFDDMGQKITTLLSSVTKLIESNKQPLSDILNNLNTTIKNINVIVGGTELNKFPKQLNKSLLEFQDTLKSAQGLMKIGDDISESMKEINKASKAFERVLKKLEEKPNSLIFGD